MAQTTSKPNWKLFYVDYVNKRLIPGDRYPTVKDATEAVLNAGKVVSKKPIYESETAWLVEIHYPTGEQLTYLIDMLAV